MTLFVILATALVAGALLLVVPPLLGMGARARAQVQRQRQAETALVVLREQRAELEADHAAGRLDAAEYARARAELEQRALDEGQAADTASDAGPARLWAVIVVLAVPLAALGVYLMLGEPDGLDPEKIVAEQRHDMNPEQMAVLVAQLADRLDADPSDPTGWMMLARAYAILGDVDGAVATWRRIGAKAPEQPDVLADWADILVAGQEGNFDGEPDRLVAKVLALDPDNVKGLALAGTAAFLRNDFATAATYWERILAHINPGEPVYASVLGSLNEARQKAGMAPIAPAPVPAPVDGAPGANAGEPSAPLSLRGTVELSPALAERTAPDQTVFVFVRPAGGGMPIAALRLRVADLPASFDFRDAQRMQEGPLPERVAVGARLSMRGDASAQPGDLESAATTVTPDASGIVLSIDRVRE